MDMTMLYKVGDEVFVTDKSLEVSFPRNRLGLNIITEISYETILYFGIWACYSEHVRHLTPLEKALR